MPGFWLMQLDLVSLKGSEVSSRRFWGVYGFSMSLGSPSGFGSVRHVYFHSCIKVALSAYLHCRQPPTCPWNLCQCFCSLVPPCTAGQSLLGRGLLWTSSQCPDPVLCIMETCVGFSHPPELALCVVGLMCTCVGSPGPSFMSRGLCAFVSAHQPALCVPRHVCPSFGSLGPAFVGRAPEGSLSSPGQTF